MGILDENDANLVAMQLLSQARQAFKSMAYTFNSGSQLFWNNPKGLSPQTISDALGTNAKELFELHYALGQLLGNIKPEAIQSGLSVIGQFTMNEDGTVTVINNL